MQSVFTAHDSPNTVLNFFFFQSCWLRKLGVQVLQKISVMQQRLFLINSSGVGTKTRDAHFWTPKLNIFTKTNFVRHLDLSGAAISVLNLS